jgi:hypothetical protein
MLLAEGSEKQELLEVGSNIFVCIILYPTGRHV